MKITSSARTIQKRNKLHNYFGFILRLRLIYLRSSNQSTVSFSSTIQNAEKKCSFKLYIEILKDEEYYDITIEVGKDTNVKVFRVHMIILYYRLPFLRRTFGFNGRNNNGVWLVLSCAFQKF